MGNTPEAWLRGPLPGVHPLLVPILRTFEQAREDLSAFAGDLTPEQLWAEPHGFGSVGFHLRHIAGSTERLLIYLQGKQLTAEQLSAAATEKDDRGSKAAELLAEIERVFRESESVVRSLDPARLTELREVGRRRLPATVIGILVHISEHTQRHLGQAISAAKWARKLS